jgi:hypothetical protein
MIKMFPGEETPKELKPVEPAGRTELTDACPNKSGCFPLCGDDLSFDAILNETCGRLEERRNRGILKRIYKMENTLENIESDLNKFLETMAKNSAGTCPARTEDVLC